MSLIPAAPASAVSRPGTHKDEDGFCDGTCEILQMHGGQLGGTAVNDGTGPDGLICCLTAGFTGCPPNNADSRLCSIPLSEKRSR